MQQRYLPELLQNGLHRESAAFFLIPEKPDPAILRSTLTCAVYHAIGLTALKDAAETGQTVARVLGMQDLVFAYMEDIPEREIQLDYYRVRRSLTYPYTKLRTFGPIHAEKMSLLRLDGQFLDMPIAAQAAGEQLRFFQKQNGKQQYLKGVDMDALETMCLRASHHLLKKYQDLF